MEQTKPPESNDMPLSFGKPAVSGVPQAEKAGTTADQPAAAAPAGGVSLMADV